MTSRRGIAIPSLILLGLAAGMPALAQQAQRVTPTTTVIGPPGIQVIRTSSTTTQLGPTALPQNNGVRLPTVDPLPSVSLPMNGSGFDFTHQAAVSGNLARRALIDPITQHKLALERDLRRSMPVVPYFPILPMTQVVVVQSPPVVIVQESPASAYAQPGVTLVAGPTMAGALREEDRAAVRVAEPSEPVPPLHEFEEMVLLRQDGKLLFAVAFTRQGEHMVYITREGIRRTVRLAELDVEGTRKLNEERGAVVKIGIRE